MDCNRPPLLFALVSLLSLLAPSLAAGVEASARLSAAASITTPEVKSHVDVLADDTFEGREAGTRGNRAAGLYIIEALKKYGVLARRRRNQLLPDRPTVEQHSGPGARPRS